MLVGQRKALGQARCGDLVGFRAADDLNDFVDVVERDHITFEDMGTLLGLGQLVASTANDNVALMIDVVAEHLTKRKNLRNTVHQRQVDDAEADLKLRVLEQLVKDDLRNHVLLQVDDDVDAAAVGGVMHVRNFGELLILNKLTELLEQTTAIHLVGDLRNDNRVIAVLLLLDARLGANGDGATAGFVRLADAIAPHDDAAGGEVGSGHDLHQLGGGDVGVVQHRAGCIDGLVEVMRRDVGSHTDGDAVGAVDQQVGEARRQNRGLLQGLIVVRVEIDGFFIQVAQ